ncbi:MAG: choice-of-anchor D domain-containing protein [Gammaproteobacteria bacterium]|jgi:hypothetical protein|nr:choice-of-anchor D domain-containing protein [Gammaproteobacteria bacterium]
MTLERNILYFFVTLAALALARPASALDEYRLDDGARESGWGAAGGTGSISFAWLNRFTAEAGQETITGLRVAFGGFSGDNNVSDGTPVTFYIWDDINQDGNPDDAFVLTSWSDVVANSGSNFLNTYTMPSPLTLTTGRIFFAGAIIDGLANVPFPNDVRVGALDEDGTDSIPDYLPNLHSFVASSNQDIPVDPDDLDGAIVPVDLVSNAFPLPSLPQYSGDGTWLIRVNAEDPSGTPQLTVTPGSLNFGVERVFGLSGLMAATLENTGTATLDITAIDSVTTPFFFNPFVSGACPMPPFNLIPGETCTLDYSFGPQADGLFTTAVTVTSNTAPPGPAPLLLQGQGVHVILETLPLNVDFGTVALGETATATLQVSNASNGTTSGFPIEVFGVNPALPPEFGVQPGTCGAFPFTVDYLDSCQLEFTVTPGAVGNFIFTTELVSDATITPAPFDLTGTSVIAEIFRDRFEVTP